MISRDFEEEIIFSVAMETFPRNNCPACFFQQIFTRKKCCVFHLFSADQLVMGIIVWCIATGTQMNTLRWTHALLLQCRWTYTFQRSSLWLTIPWNHWSAKRRLQLLWLKCDVQCNIKSRELCSCLDRVLQTCVELHIFRWKDKLLLIKLTLHTCTCCDGWLFITNPPNLNILLNITNPWMTSLYSYCKLVFKTGKTHLQLELWRVPETWTHLQEVWKLLESIIRQCSPHMALAFYFSMKNMFLYINRNLFHRFVALWWHLVWNPVISLDSPTFVLLYWTVCCSHIVKYFCTCPMHGEIFLPSHPLVRFCAGKCRFSAHEYVLHVMRMSKSRVMTSLAGVVTSLELWRQEDAHAASQDAWERRRGRRFEKHWTFNVASVCVCDLCVSVCVRVCACVCVCVCAFSHQTDEEKKCLFFLNLSSRGFVLCLLPPQCLNRCKYLFVYFLRCLCAVHTCVVLINICTFDTIQLSSDADSLFCIAQGATPICLHPRDLDLVTLLTLPHLNRL